MKTINKNYCSASFWLRSFIFFFNRTAVMLVLAIVLFSCTMKDAFSYKDNTVEKESGNMNTHLTTNNYIRDIVNHPAFKSFGELLLPWNDNSEYYDTRLTSVGSLMPYHGHVRPDIVLDAVNYMIDEVKKGRIIFYDFYTEEQKQQDPEKRNTGLFFYRGNPDSPFAVVCPGGGFSYVGSLHEGFPLALEISKHGFNAFVIRYRIGSEQKATEDLAAAITYIFRNADKLGVKTKYYSLWGGSAGARMAGNIALNDIAGYGGNNLPKPSTVVIAYTGQSGYSENLLLSVQTTG